MAENKEIDESLYSRQLYIIDHASMRRVMSSNVLIIGLGGLGVEIAKNVILTGVKSVTLYDTQNTSYLDLASQFYLGESDIGKNRAAQSIAKLIELNEHVAVNYYDGELSENFLSSFQVIVATDLIEEQQIQLNDICRKHNIKFISGEIRGVFARAFCDFGNDFSVNDLNGEPASSYIISSITTGEKTVITVNDDTRLTLESGDHVTFNDVTGCEGLNNIPPTPVEVLGPFSFSINVSTVESGHASGYVREVKVPKSFTFQTLVEQRTKPEFIYTDFSKSPEQLHTAFLGLHQYWKSTGHLPEPQNVEHFQSVLSFANSINSEHKFVDQINESIIKSLSFTSIASINPIAAFLGGVIGQEVLKACTGKFMPIKQWLYFDAIETLPENTQDSFVPLSTRYDSNIIVFGKELQEKLQDLNYFLVGSGAIGCEMLKNWAMMGIASRKGSIYVTDMDNIEKSNLNRQFLFRPKDVGNPKSEAASEAVKAMNPSINIVPYTNRVGEDTEHIFNDVFFEKLDGVCNALDNVDARMYMDGRCIHYKLPLLESGTLGTKANSQVIVPFLTESYASSRDPPEKTIPMCTLHHFPNRIEHTIQWSRDEFEGLFKNTSENVNAFLSVPNYLESLEKQNFAVRLETVKSIHSSLISDKPSSFEDCIQWARLRFEEYFSNNIKQLLYNFPADLITSTGLPFWSGSKRAPSPLTFDKDNELHISFVHCAANLRAFNFGLKGSDDRELIKEIAARTSVPDFVPAKGVHIPADDKSNNDNTTKQTNVQQDEVQLRDFTNAIINASQNLSDYRLFPAEFEKDDDTNYHIDFITACSNLRATNYSIPTADRHTTKGIAGKIIPAMVTTTAMVTGLVCIELLKIAQKKKLDQYKNGFVNLSLPFFGFSEPIPPPTTKVRDGWEWNLWDRFEVDGPLTLAQLIEHFKQKYSLEISMVSAGMTLMYAFFMKKPVLDDRLPMEIAALYEKVSQKELHVNETSVVLTICASKLEDGEDVDIPWICYRIPKNKN